MAQTPPPTVDALPTSPETSSPSTFDTLADAFLLAMITLRTQLVALVANCYNNAVDCYNNAVAAAASALAASGSATAAANTATAIAASAAAISGASVWVSGTTYAIGDCRYSPITFATYRRRTTGAGTTDPSVDSTNWAPPVPTGFRNLVVLTSTQTWVPPTADVTRAEITVVDGGSSSESSTGGGAKGGDGGNAGTTVLSVDPSVTYTATIGAGGVGGVAGTSTASQPGGATSFSGSGITTVTSSNATLKRKGGPPMFSSSSSLSQGGTSLHAPNTPLSTATSEFGAGGAAQGAGNAAGSGFAGVVIIRY